MSETQQIIEAIERAKQLIESDGTAISFMRAENERLTAENAALKEQVAGLERERDYLQTQYRDVSIELLSDDQRRTIEKLIREHGDLDEDCWEELVNQRDKLQADLHQHMQLVKSMGERCDRLTTCLREWLEREEPSTRLIEETDALLNQETT